MDDNHDLADSIAALLEILGYEATACYDGTTALNLAPKFEPDICLIDLNMPGMDGDELALKLRTAMDSVVLVAVTAMSDERSSLRIRNAGFHRHLIKPVAPKEIVQLVEEFAHSKGAE